MKVLEMLETYPKSAIVVKQWFLEKMLESLNDDSLPEDFKEHVRSMGIDNDKVAGMVEHSPRALFDVFDEHKIFIQINVNTPYFSYSINGGDVISGSWDLRKDAERSAVQQAFNLLNEKL